MEGKACPGGESQATLWAGVGRQAGVEAAVGRQGTGRRQSGGARLTLD